MQLAVRGDRYRVGFADEMSYCTGLGLPHAHPYIFFYTRLSSNTMIHERGLTDATRGKVGQSFRVGLIMGV